MLSNSAYEIRWVTVREQKEQRVKIEIAATIRKRLIVDVRTFINHPYI